MKNKSDTKQNKKGLLDQTVNDFEDQKVLFRYPKHSIGGTQLTESKIKSRGRPRKSTKLASKSSTHVTSQSKSTRVSSQPEQPESVVSIIDSPEESSEDICSHLSQDESHQISDQEINEESHDDLIELEKSICSNSEKLCPSCKRIVLINEYPIHVSECLQKFSYSKEKSTTKEIIRILPCPVCYKAFISTTEKQVHVKMCGLSHGLTPQQLIEASKLQAKQEEERLALGLPSPQVIQHTKEIRKRTDASKPRGSKSSDPELELAFALSRSLVEEERKNQEIEEDKLASLGLHDILQEKRRKLVLPQPPPLYSSKGTRGLKGKRKGRPITALMRRTREERERIITEKVAAILAGEFDPPVPPPENRFKKEQTSKFICDVRYNKELHLWKFAQTGLEIPTMSYYVTELVDYIKPEQVLPYAELLKKYSGIPGKLNYTALAEDSDEENEDYDSGDPVETTIVDAYCTQLALAELLCSQDVDDLTFNIYGGDALEGTEIKGGAKDLVELMVHENNPVQQNENLNVFNNNSLDVYFNESKAKESNNESVSQNRVISEENPKVSNDIELVCLSSDDENDMSSAASFSPRKLQKKTDVSSSAVFVSPQKNQKESDKSTSSKASFLPPKVRKKIDVSLSAVLFSPLKIQEESNNSTSSASFSPKKVQEKTDGNLTSSAVLFSPGRIQAVSDNGSLSTVLFSPQKNQEKSNNSKSSTVSLSPRKVQTKIDVSSSAVLISPGKNQKVSDNSVSTLSFSPVKIQKQAQSSVLKVLAPSDINIVKPIIQASSATGSPSNSQERDFTFHSKLIHDWSCLLANGEHSDIVIKTEESEISVHSLVLLCRCSKILSEVVEEKTSSMEENVSGKRKWLDWSKCSYDAAYSFIVYLYTGGCLVKQKDKDGTWLGLYDLALQYGCSELIEHLESMYRSSCDSILENEDTGNSAAEGTNSELIKENIKEKITQSLVNNYIQRTPLSVIGSCSSPDIFGEWDSAEQPALIDSVNVTPPGATLGDNTLKCFKSPLLNIESTSSFYRLNSAKDLTTKLEAKNEDGNFPDCVGNKSISNEKSNKELSKRNLSHEFKEVTNNSRSSFSCNPESPTLRMSSFSDMEYPSVNEIVDLTFSSEQSGNEDIKDSYKCDNSGNFTKDNEENDISLPSLEFEDYNDDNCPDLSSLIHKPTSSVGKNLSLDRSNIEIFLPKKRTHSELSKESSHQGVSDDSILRAVCDLENDLRERIEKKQSDKKNFKNPNQKLYKSKSCFEASTSTMVTPNKDNNFPLNNNYNITPMPDYKSMMTPELRKELDKYGIRKMSRKKAITMLLHIYEETHPFVTDSEAEQSFVDSPKVAKLSLPASPARTRGGKAKRGGVRGKKIEAKKSCDADLNSSQSSNSSANSSFECLEETFLPGSQDETDDVTPTQEVRLENRLKIFIRSDDELYSRILRYDPIWANELQRDLKLNGIKCSMAKLITFLDEQCITFRFPTKERSRKRRRKNSSPGKSPKKKKKS